MGAAVCFVAGTVRPVFVVAVSAPGALPFFSVFCGPVVYPGVVAGGIPLTLVDASATAAVDAESEELPGDPYLLRRG